MISSSRILYTLVFAVMFCLSFYGLTALDFSRFTRPYSVQKIYLLLFLLSLGIAWMSTQALFSLTVGSILTF